MTDKRELIIQGPPPTIQTQPEPEDIRKEEGRQNKVDTPSRMDGQSRVKVTKDMTSSLPLHSEPTICCIAGKYAIA